MTALILLYTRTISVLRQTARTAGFVAAASCLLSGCTPSVDLPLGEEVIVQFDRSSLGAGAMMPVSPDTEIINGAKTAIRGRLVGVDSEWIVLERSMATQVGTTVEKFWISRAAVLLIERETVHGN